MTDLIKIIKANPGCVFLIGDWDDWTLYKGKEDMREPLARSFHGCILIEALAEIAGAKVEFL